ncbi:MAG TPA: SDR family NAD(P)-dependent oxidoreductase [Candidatus Sulfotelmatobacter sp.]|nr:SDR family NAD(P)-dependent oxidoreductase [Candidatus Sulfotelmatobacter sp.]
MTLSGRSALITGGGRGIGLAIAMALARQGARVAIASRRQDQLAEAARELERGGAEALALSMDVVERDEVEAGVAEVARRWGRLDILVNNAGASGMTPLNGGEGVDRLWHQILTTNLTGMYYVTRAALPGMPDNAHGRIINISSVLGKFGVAGYAAYCASKHGVIGFTRALALELAPRGITVNAICPGWVDTDMARQGIAEMSAALHVPPEEFRRQAMEAVPLKRMVEGAEVGALAAYLASEAAAAMTGQAINLCGGATTA